MDEGAESIRFGAVELDLAALTIRVDGEPVHVEPQVFDVLVHLVRHRERVVPKTELLDRVWGDRFVSESALTSRVKDARRAVGDDGRAQRVIRTVHGRGYQFVADVTARGRQPAPPAGVTVAIARSGDHRDFVGREQELTAVLDALAAHQLVTVIGPGGIGKTRLASEAGRVWEDEGHSVHLVELDDVTSADQVPRQICNVLGVRSEIDFDLVALAAQELRGDTRLLILDNFEHVADAAMDVTRLIELAPELHVCVTSRERLRVSGEQLMQLEGLDASPSAGIEAPAVVLFEKLARRLDPSFTVDDANVALVAEICSLVDGLPLGLDLAAAQLSHMPLAYLREHLERNAMAIGHDLRDRPARQRSVTELIGWSHAQLTPAAQRLLARLSVFRGDIPLSGVRAVGEFDSDLDALQAVARLVDKSLVVADDVGTEPRYTVLNLIRSFAADRLEDAGDTPAARGLHAAWVADVVARIEADRWDRNVAGWQHELRRSYPNLAVALEHLDTTGDVATLGRIVADTNLWWYRVGRHDEARRWVDVALGGQDRLDTRARGRVQLLAGLMALAGRDLASATEHYGLAIRFAGEAHDWRYLQLARAYHAVRALDDPTLLADATAEIEAVVAAAADRDDLPVLAHALNMFGLLLHRTGREEESRRQHERGVEVNRRIGDTYNEALAHANLGHIEVEAGRADTALVSSRTALVLASRSGASLLAAWMLSEIASAERLRGHPEEAAVLMGASEGYIDAVGAHRGPAAHQTFHEMTVDALRAELGDADYQRLHDEGAALPFATAIERALDQRP